MNNTKTLLYCSVWPDEQANLSLESQSVELQTYCLMNGLDAVDLISDMGPSMKGQLRTGMESLLNRVMREEIGHVVIYDVGRIGRDSKEIMAFLRDTFDPTRTQVHICAWKLSTASPEYAKFMSMASEIVGVDSTHAVQEQVDRSEKQRLKPLWIKLFGLLQDERYAEVLIKALFQIKDSVPLSEKEYVAVHGGYDHLNMFRALGFRIKGEKTDNTRLVADVLVRSWDRLKFHLGPDLHKNIESSETGAIL